jgi:hypothetical protein
VIYKSGRLLGGHDRGRALDNAHRLWDVQRALHLPREQDVQGLVLHAHWLVRVTNAFYAQVNFPLTGLVLLWLLLYRPRHYRWAKWSLIVASASGLVFFVILPMAPPRMLPDLGFVDTGVLMGQSAYGAPGASAVSNQYAAMPSLHVGWAVIVAVVLISACRTRARWLWVAHPVVTLYAVVATGNHFWADAAVGAAVVTAALRLTRGVLNPPLPAVGTQVPIQVAPAVEPAR